MQVSPDRRAGRPRLSRRPTCPGSAAEIVWNCNADAAVLERLGKSAPPPLRDFLVAKNAAQAQAVEGFDEQDAMNTFAYVTFEVSLPRARAGGWAVYVGALLARVCRTSNAS